MSRTQKRKMGSSYQAAVVPAIADIAALPIEPTVASHAEDAAQEIARFDAEHSPRIDPYGVILLRSESAASSRIEQLDTTAKAVALAELGEASSNTASLVVANSNAMRAASTLSDDISSRTIIEMQRILLADSPPNRVGRFRNEQVWIGGSDFWPSPDAMFIAPHHSRVSKSMEDLVAFVDRDDLSPVLAQVFIAHAQFETIHPFTDGNGRTGRALAHAMLRSKGVARSVTVPISAGLLNNTTSYFHALDTYREGDPNPIVERFADATYAGITNASTLVSEIDEIEQDWYERVGGRSDSAARRLIPALVRQPAINVRYATESLRIPEPTARRAIDRLVETGVLTQAGGGQRYRRWVANDVLAALDRFASRSRRSTA